MRSCGTRRRDAARAPQLVVGRLLLAYCVEKPDFVFALPPA